MKNYSLKCKIIFKLSVLIFSFSFFLCVNSGLFNLASEASAAGASLFLSPSTGTYQVDNTFSAEVRVNSGGAAINAAGGTLNFNINELEVVKISKTGSIFSLWTTEPIFSNSAGNIIFEGGTPSAFTGSAGTILAITFQAKIAATTNVNFYSGSVLAADGKGTNILASMEGGTYSLKPKVVISEPPEPEEEYVPPFTLGVPAAPKISSPTHPNSEEWYSNNSPKFSWLVPEGITGVRLLYDKYSRTAPTVFYSSPISEKQLEDLSDGVWYFHCQLRNEFGWGGITHFKFKIDTKPPEPFEIEVKGGKETTNPRPILIFDTIDSLSGIEYYEVKIGDSEGISVTHEDIKTNPYQMPVQAPGKHTVIIKAVDRAGNYSLAMVEINILPIEAPIITDYPRILTIDSLLSLKGISIPNAEIKIYIQDKEERIFLQTTKSNEKGVWYFAYVRPLSKGIYQVWAEAINLEGARSEPSEKVTVQVSLPAFIKIGKLEIDHQTILIILLVLILILGVWFIFVRLTISKKSREFRKKSEEVRESLKIGFKNLRKVAKQHLEELEEIKTKRELTDEENRIRKTLKENLEVAEKFIEKEI